MRSLILAAGLSLVCASDLYHEDTVSLLQVRVQKTQAATSTSGDNSELCCDSGVCEPCPAALLDKPGRKRGRGRFKSRKMRTGRKPTGGAKPPTKPDFVKPDFVKPDFVKPDFVKPDFVKPDFVKPDFVKPDFVKPDLVKPTKPPTAPVDPMPPADEASAVGDPHMTSLSGATSDLCCDGGHCQPCALGFMQDIGMGMGMGMGKMGMGMGSMGMGMGMGIDRPAPAPVVAEASALGDPHMTSTSVDNLDLCCDSGVCEPCPAALLDKPGRKRGRGRFKTRKMRTGRKPTGGAKPPTKPDFVKPDFVKPDFVKPDFVKPDFVKPDFVKPDFVKPDFVKPDFVKPDFVKPTKPPTAPVDPMPPTDEASAIGDPHITTLYGNTFDLH